MLSGLVHPSWRQVVTSAHYLVHVRLDVRVLVFVRLDRRKYTTLLFLQEGFYFYKIRPISAAAGARFPSTFIQRAGTMSGRRHMKEPTLSQGTTYDSRKMKRPRIAMFSTAPQHFCVACRGENGRLVRCSACGEDYHPFCLYPPRKRLPEKGWVCCVCSPPRSSPGAVASAACHPAPSAPLPQAASKVDFRTTALVSSVLTRLSKEEGQPISSWSSNAMDTAKTTRGAASSYVERATNHVADTVIAWVLESVGDGRLEGLTVTEVPTEPPPPRGGERPESTRGKIRRKYIGSALQSGANLLGPSKYRSSYPPSKPTCYCGDTKKKTSPCVSCKSVFHLQCMDPPRKTIKALPPTGYVCFDCRLECAVCNVRLLYHASLSCMITCCGCERAFHRGCIDPPILGQPKRWECHECDLSAFSSSGEEVGIKLGKETTPLSVTTRPEVCMSILAGGSGPVPPQQPGAPKIFAPSIAQEDSNINTAKGPATTPNISVVSVLARDGAAIPVNQLESIQKSTAAMPRGYSNADKAKCSEAGSSGGRVEKISAGSDIALPKQSESPKKLSTAIMASEEARTKAGEASNACEICGDAEGKKNICSSCKKGYHSRCLGRPRTRRAGDSWRCDNCRASTPALECVPSSVRAQFNNAPATAGGGMLARVSAVAPVSGGHEVEVEKPPPKGTGMNGRWSNDEHARLLKVRV